MGREGPMVIQTSRFGPVSLQIEDVIEFPEGILGFNDLRKFVLLDDPNDELPIHEHQGGQSLILI